jgi:hypothetical protein
MRRHTPTLAAWLVLLSILFVNLPLFSLNVAAQKQSIKQHERTTRLISQYAVGSDDLSENYNKAIKVAASE